MGFHCLFSRAAEQTRQSAVALLALTLAGILEGILMEINTCQHQTEIRRKGGLTPSVRVCSERVCHCLGQRHESYKHSAPVASVLMGRCNSSINKGKSSTCCAFHRLLEDQKICFRVELQVVKLKDCVYIISGLRYRRFLAARTYLAKAFPAQIVP